MSRLLTTALLLLCLLPIVTSTAIADILRVPSEYERLHLACEEAGSGDTVLVAAGTYTGAAATGAYINGKSLSILVEGDGPAIFEAGDGFLQIAGPSTQRVLVDGFAFRGGNTIVGAIELWGNGQVTLSHCSFEDIVAGETAAVWATGDVQVTLSQCQFTSNQCYDGYIVRLRSNRSTLIEACTFTGNRGDTIYVQGSGGARLVRTYFRSDAEGRTSLFASTSVELEHCAFLGRQTGRSIEAFGTCTVRSCTFAGSRVSSAVRFFGSGNVAGSVFAGNCGADIRVPGGLLHISCSVLDSVSVESGTVTYGEGMVFGEAALCDVPSCEEPWRLGDYRLVAGTVAASCPPCGFIYGAFEETCPGGGTGACCVGGECLDLSSECCAWNGGVYGGDGVPCTPELCDQPIPIRRSTWGAIKARW